MCRAAACTVSVGVGLAAVGGRLITMVDRPRTVAPWSVGCG